MFRKLFYGGFLIPSTNPFDQLLGAVAAACNEVCDDLFPAVSCSVSRAPVKACHISVYEDDRNRSRQMAQNFGFQKSAIRETIRKKFKQRNYQIPPGFPIDIRAEVDWASYGDRPGKEFEINHTNCTFLIKIDLSTDDVDSKSDSGPSSSDSYTRVVLARLIGLGADAHVLLSVPKPDVTIGVPKKGDSSVADLQFPESYQDISRRHARLYRDGGSWFLEDHGSTNGTALNGGQLQSRVSTRVCTGDVIDLAGHKFRFEETSPTERPSGSFTVIRGKPETAPPSPPGTSLATVSSQAYLFDESAGLAWVLPQGVMRYFGSRGDSVRFEDEPEFKWNLGTGIFDGQCVKLEIFPSALEKAKLHVLRSNGTTAQESVVLRNQDAAELIFGSMSVSFRCRF